ncbi:MAG: ComEA family DNA-binding protein [Clostridia bacterium]|nr:ComEA family DNA-binding protein [Clostridia bacterium]
MYNFNKKQKIILGILVAIIAGFICYYVYAKEDSSLQLNLENTIETEEQVQSQEEYSDDTILVHISGAVNKEGMVELKINSRISDAIDKAEGIREDACIEDVNLAYKLEDGMKIHIPTKQEKENNKNITEELLTTSSGVLHEEEETEEKANKASQKNVKVNINTATQTQLETLPGIGPSTAMKVISYRKENGKFSKIEDIKQVSGIGDSKYNKIKDLIVVK